MPDLDMTEVLTAREFTDSFSFISNFTTINSSGVASITSSLLTNTTGVVIPGKANLRRLDDGTRVTAYIDIYTKSSLTVGIKTNDTTSQNADIVTWRGRQYTVVAVEDYSNFGTGWIHASCDLLTLSSPT